jgi:hypothetical protein
MGQNVFGPKTYPCQYIERRTQYDNVFISYTCETITPRPSITGNVEILRDSYTESEAKGRRFVYLCTLEQRHPAQQRDTLQADRDIVTPLCVFSRQGRCQGVLAGAIRKAMY